MNDRMKNRVRRAIRVLMVGVAVVLLITALAIPLVNNYIAHGIRKDMEALTLPPDTRLVDGVSVAGKVTAAGDGVQYFAAVLLQSQRSLEELRTHYAGLESEDGTLTAAYRVEPQQGAVIRPIEVGQYTFEDPAEGEGYYIVYTLRNSNDGFLNMDIRGH